MIVGNTASWAIETYYCRHLINLGIETRIFDCSTFHGTSLLYKIRFHLSDQSIYKALNKALLAHCEKEKPEAIWVFKGVEIFTETLSKLRKKGFFLLNYNPDHPFVRTSVSHGGKNIAESIPLYHLHFSYRLDLVEHFKTHYMIPSEWLPFGYELPNAVYDEIVKEKEINRLCFIGTPDKERSAMLCELARQGYPIDIYGQNYQDKKKLLACANIRLHDVVLGIAFWKKIRQYRVQLNFLRLHNIGSHNQRTMEVPAAGGILLTPDSEEQRMFFDEGKEMFFYHSTNNLMENIEHLLNKAPDEIAELRYAGRKRSVESAYSYADRAKVVYETLTKI